jgi:hypothetical protein
MSATTGVDAELDAVVSELQKLDPDGTRVARVLRDTFDQLYDGQRTGRYYWEKLFKTEKTHCGTVVEINLQREFKFGNGVDLDYQIAGVEVDCKYSQTLGGWMIPPEARNKLCLLLSAVDSAVPKWSMGIVRITDASLNSGANRDAKATLNSLGRSSITWLFQNESLPPNVLLQLDRSVVDGILALKSGQQRVNALLRIALEKRVGRAVIATMAQQDDPMKRVRANGGARTTLGREGILILGQYQAHCDVARTLGVPVPGPGESVPVRVAVAERGEPGTVRIGDRYWRKALPTDPPVQAPELPYS